MHSTLCGRARCGMCKPSHIYGPILSVFACRDQDPAYWASWTITHFSNMAVSGVLCALVGTYPFSHSSATVLLAFYWLVALALISFAYFLSTMFSKSRIAGTATTVIYAVSMVPGCVRFLNALSLVLFVDEAVMPQGCRLSWLTSRLRRPPCPPVQLSVP